MTCSVARLETARRNADFVRERVKVRGGNLPREGVDSWKRNAEPNRQESQAGRQAGNRSIALARTHGPVSRYTSRRGILRLLWVAPVQNVANATIFTCM